MKGKKGHEMEAKEKKEDRRVRRTKKLLTQALTSLLQEKQVNEITVRELTELADMNRGTFYLYYKDIYDMLEKTEDGLFSALEEIMDAHEKEAAGLQTRPLLLDLFHFIRENREMVRVLLSPHGDMNFLHRLFEVIRERCMEAFPALPAEQGEADFDYRYSFLVFGTAGLIRAWVSRDCREPAEEMADLADEMIRKGGLNELI